MIEKRELSIDLIKILACCGVVGLHTINGSLALPNLLICIIATVSMPLFFTINGYLLFRHNRIDYKYILKKILKIFIVCFMWEFIHAVVYFLYYNSFRNFIKSFILDFFQKGLFYHFWFMGALIIVYLFVPFFRLLANKNIKLYMILLLLLGFVCVGIDIYTMITQNDITANVNQTLRIWIWMFYFMLGGLIRLKKEYIVGINQNKALCGIFVCSIFFLIIWRITIANYIYGSYSVGSIYGGIPVIIAVLSIVICAVSKDLKFCKNLVKFISPLIMGIYIFHPFVLSVIVHFIPAVLDIAWFNIFYYLFVIVISVIISYVVSKIPLIKELIKI